MTFHIVLTSIITGLTIGLLYGLFFVFSRRRVFVSGDYSTRGFIFSSLSSCLRLVVLAAIFFYLLRLNSINFIILLQSFLIMFWFVVLKQPLDPSTKAQQDER